MLTPSVRPQPLRPQWPMPTYLAPEPETSPSLAPLYQLGHRGEPKGHSHNHGNCSVYPRTSEAPNLSTRQVPSSLCFPSTFIHSSFA